MTSRRTGVGDGARRHLVALGLLASSVAWGKAPEVVRVVERAAQGGEGGAGGCPTVEAVVRGVRAGLPGVRVAGGGTGEQVAGEALVTVEDRGARFVVTVAGVERGFEDAARRCDERARAAAVFVGLTLDPVELGEGGSEGVGASPAASTGTSTSTSTTATATATATATGSVVGADDGGRRRRMVASVELAGSLAMGARAGTHVMGGVGVKVLLGREWWALGLGVGALAADTLPVGPKELRLARVPLDLALRVRRQLGPLTLAAEAGWEVGLQISWAPATGDVGVRPETGAHVAARAGWWATRSTELFVALEWVPLVYRVEIGVKGADGDGTTGAALPLTSSPRHWFGLSFGAALTFL